MTLRRRLLMASGAMLPSNLARADLADPLAQAIAVNPALAAISTRDAAAARALAADAARLLAAPPAGMRRSEQPDAADQALLRGNPLLGALYRHDPAAALDLLARVKQAGGQRQ